AARAGRPGGDQHLHVRALPRLQGRRGPPPPHPQEAEMTRSANTTWRLVSLSPLPLWVLVGLSLLVLLGVVLAVVGLSREPSSFRRRMVLVLRLLAGALALFFLPDPRLRQR